MNFITDLTFIGGVFITFTIATIIMFQVIKALASAISMKMNKSAD